MGQKVNPHGARVGVIKNWDARWYADKKDFADNLISDAKLREMIKNFEFVDDKSNRTVKLYDAGVSKIEIERRFDNDKTRVTVTLNVAKPGIVIGANGANIEKIKAAIIKHLGGAGKVQVLLNVQEIKSPDLDAQLVAENIAQQLENRVSFRRAMKKCLQSSMRAGAKGIKTSVGGRLGGADIARSEGYHEGSIPLQTLRADIDYGFAEAKTAYGRLGVKVWIYKGQVLPTAKKAAAKTEGGK
ncbi:MAG: 30S ribosomal protein S3 [Clostridia bacterium]|jgi:small subunit ribosomal protein S3|nr:30S ribosomal protein S3 [Clostridia bacterium]